MCLRRPAGCKSLGDSGRAAGARERERERLRERLIRTRQLHTQRQDKARFRLHRAIHHAHKLCGSVDNNLKGSYFEKRSCSLYKNRSLKSITQCSGSQCNDLQWQFSSNQSVLADNCE